MFRMGLSGDKAASFFHEVRADLETMSATFTLRLGSKAQLSDTRERIRIDTGATVFDSDPGGQRGPRWRD